MIGYLKVIMLKYQIYLNMFEIFYNFKHLYNYIKSYWTILILHILYQRSRYWVLNSSILLYFLIYSFL